MNTELFYENQLDNKSITWRLYASGKESPSSSNLVLTGLLGDTEVSYGVSHDFGNADDGVTNAVSSIVGSLNKGMDIVRTAGIGVSTVQDIANKINNSGVGEVASDLLTGFDNLVNKAKDLNVGNVRLGDKLSSRFVSALDFIKVFKGTSVNIDLPKLEVILFNDDDGDDVVAKVEKLNDYFIGDVSDELGIFGLQDAPNGYIPSYQGISKTTKFDGTFTLQLGDKYSINNLIVKDYNVSLSQLKQKGSEYPLYAEVSVSLEFASYISKKHIAQFLRPMS